VFRHFDLQNRNFSARFFVNKNSTLILKTVCPMVLGRNTATVCIGKKSGIILDEKACRKVTILLTLTEKQDGWTIVT
jgi:hypothetical protein